MLSSHNCIDKALSLPKNQIKENEYKLPSGRILILDKIPKSAMDFFALGKAFLLNNSEEYKTYKIKGCESLSEENYLTAYDIFDEAETRIDDEDKNYNKIARFKTVALHLIIFLKDIKLIHKSLNITPSIHAQILNFVEAHIRLLETQQEANELEFKMNGFVDSLKEKLDRLDKKIIKIKDDILKKPEPELLERLATLSDRKKSFEEKLLIQERFKSVNKRFSEEHCLFSEASLKLMEMFEDEAVPELFFKKIKEKYLSLNNESSTKINLTEIKELCLRAIAIKDNQIKLREQEDIVLDQHDPIAKWVLHKDILSQDIQQLIDHEIFIQTPFYKEYIGDMVNSYAEQAKKDSARRCLQMSDEEFYNQVSIILYKVIKQLNELNNKPASLASENLFATSGTTLSNDKSPECSPVLQQAKNSL